MFSFTFTFREIYGAPNIAAGLWCWRLLNFVELLLYCQYVYLTKGLCLQATMGGVFLARSWLDLMAKRQSADLWCVGRSILVHRYSSNILICKGSVVFVCDCFLHSFLAFLDDADRKHLFTCTTQKHCDEWVSCLQQAGWASLLCVCMTLETINGHHLMPPNLCMLWSYYIALVCIESPFVFLANLSKSCMCNLHELHCNSMLVVH